MVTFKNPLEGSEKEQKTYEFIESLGYEIYNKDYPYFCIKKYKHKERKEGFFAKYLNRLDYDYPAEIRVDEGEIYIEIYGDDFKDEMMLLGDKLEKKFKTKVVCMLMSHEKLKDSLSSGGGD